MPNDDTELLALGPQLEQIADEWLAQTALDRTERAIHDTKVEQLTGIAPHDAPPYSKDAPYWTIHEAVPHEPGLLIDKAWNDIHARLFPLCERILARRAHTLDGLRVQATAVSLAAAEIWDTNPYPDEPHHERAFIEATCAFLGVVPVPPRTQPQAQPPMQNFRPV